MQRTRTSILILAAGLTLTISALIVLYLDDGTLFYNQPFTTTTPEGDQLNGVYYPGTLTPNNLDPDTSNPGILLLEGFGSDQGSMRSLANEFNNVGFPVFTVDFSGQGSSPGALTFDNTQTDRLAQQVLQVEKSIPAIIGVEKMQLIVIGHGLGGRAALQAAMIDPSPIKGLVLIGPQINLASSQQAEIFSSTSDLDLLWVRQLGGNNPKTNILILSSLQDDQFTQDSGYLLLQALTKSPENANNLSDIIPGRTYSAEGEPNRLWLLFPDQTHTFEVDDSRIIAAALDWSQKELLPDNTPTLPVSPAAETRNWMWIIGVAGVFISAEGFRRVLRHRIHHHTPNLHGLEIVNLRRFLLSKVILWLAAIPLMALVAGIMLLIPLPKPVFNLYFVCILGGFGLLTLILSGFGLIPGTRGSLKFSMVFKKLTVQRVALTLEFNLAMLLAIGLLVDSGFYNFPPTGLRLAWILILAPFTALGFWFHLLENDLLNKSYPDNHVARFLAGFISSLPFLIYLLVMAFEGMTTYLILGLEGLVILALVLWQGIVTYRLTGHRWLTAILQALALFLLVLPIGALFNL